MNTYYCLKHDDDLKIVMTPCSSVSIVNFEQVNAHWVAAILKFQSSVVWKSLAEK